MPKILAYLTNEMGETIKQATERVLNLKLECQTATRPIHSGFSFNQADYSIYTYVRPSNHERVFLVELRVFVPPDALIFHSWVLDDLPEDAALHKLWNGETTVGTTL